MKHDYTLKASRVAISPTTNYGYWERADGIEGGGLWFDGKNLKDSDGAYELPKAVIEEIRALGYTVGSDFESEPEEEESALMYDLTKPDPYDC